MMKGTVESHKEELQNLSIEKYSWIIDQFDLQKIIIIPSVSSLVQHLELKEGFSFIKSAGIESFLLAPLIRGRTLIGFLGFASRDDAIAWQEEDIMLLRTVGETFANA